MIFFSIYNKFKSKRWNTYSPKKRVRIFQKVLNKLCHSYRLKKIGLELDSSLASNVNGMYKYHNKREQISLNPKLILKQKQFLALETIFHEFRHCYQKNIINKQTSFWDFRAKKWKKNYQGYISITNNDYEFYNIQPIEVDAKEFALKKLRFQFLRFRKEPSYIEQMQDLKSNIKNANRQAREKHGIFYKLKMRRSIRKNANKNR